MKNLKRLGLVCGVLACAAVMYSCEKSADDVNSVETEASLKSAAPGKTSYIVTLNDLELNAQLASTLGYGKKKDKVSAAVEKLLKKLDVTDGEIEYVYASALKGFAVKLPPGQVKKLEGDPSIARIEEDQVIALSPIVVNRITSYNVCYTKLLRTP